MPQVVYRTVQCDGKDERQQVLMLQRHEWDNYNEHLVRRRKEAAHVEFLHDKRETVKNKSKELKATWRNTQLNVRERTLQARAERLAGQEAYKAERSMEMQQIRAAERKIYLEECKKLVSYTKEDIHLLNNALVLSETLRERDAQLAFEKKLKVLQEKLDQLYVEKVEADVKAFQMEEAKKKEEARKAMLRYRDVLISQIKTIEKEKKEEFDIERKLQVEDLINIHNEIELGKRLEREQLERDRAKVRKDVHEALENVERCRIEKQKEDEEENKVIAVYAAAKDRIENRRRTVEQEAQEQMRQRRAKIAETIGVAKDTRDAKENASIKKALAEREAKELKELQQKEAKVKKQIEDSIRDYKAFVEREENRKEMEKNLVKWEMLQRFKAEEVNKEYADNVQKMRREKILATRKMYLEDIAERKVLAALKRSEEVDDVKAKWEEEDKAFLKYADEMVEDSKKKGRSLYPIQKVIVEFKIQNGLMNVKKDRRLHQSKLTIGTKNDTPSDLCICYDKSPQNLLA